MKSLRFVILSALSCTFVLLPATSIAGEHFDGSWLTKLTCPPKGNTDGYTWQFVSVIQNGNFHGARGTADQPGYYTLDGKIADNGSAKLSANGIVASRQYARGVFAHKGESYGYDVKAQFQETTGTGAKSEGLGIVGRTCIFEFTKQPAGEGAPAPAQ
jgi:hypothetical protein